LSESFASSHREYHDALADTDPLPNTNTDTDTNVVSEGGMRASEQPVGHTDDIPAPALDRSLDSSLGEDSSAVFGYGIYDEAQERSQQEGSSSDLEFLGAGVRP
jgi:hypothetical protein